MSFLSVDNTMLHITFHKLAMRYLAGVESVCSQRPPFSFWTSHQCIQCTPTALSLGSSHKPFLESCGVECFMLNICAVLMYAKRLANHWDLCWFRPEGGRGAWAPIPCPPLDPPLGTVFHYNPAWKNTRLLSKVSSCQYQRWKQLSVVSCHWSVWLRPRALTLQWSRACHSN